jgi:hypothetical protein
MGAAYGTQKPTVVVQRPLDAGYNLPAVLKASLEVSDAPIGAPVAPGILAMMRDAYGHSTMEIGYETEGHMAVRAADYDVARSTQSSLLYGEVLPHVRNSHLSYNCVPDMCLPAALNAGCHEDDR